MILVDLNQVLISNLMAQVRGKGDVKPNKEMIRHMVLTSLRGFNAKFGQEYGQMVLCSDASEPWRKDFFPNYKFSRKCVLKLDIGFLIRRWSGEKLSVLPLLRFPNFFERIFCRHTCDFLITT